MLGRRLVCLIPAKLLLVYHHKEALEPGKDSWQISVQLMHVQEGRLGGVFCSTGNSPSFAASQVAVLALVMYGADRHVLRGQLTGGWSSEGTTVTFYEEGTYRWHSGDTAGPPVIHRGFFRIVGRDQISLTDVGVTAAEPFTPATATYTAHVVADQLTLQNARQTLIFIRAAQ